MIVNNFDGLGVEPLPRRRRGRDRLQHHRAPPSPDRNLSPQRLFRRSGVRGAVVGDLLLPDPVRPPQRPRPLRLERDYQELKREVGLGHYEGRGWRGFHHHTTLCIAAYGFLISERETVPPSGHRAPVGRSQPAAPYRTAPVEHPHAQSDTSPTRYRPSAEDSPSP